MECFILVKPYVIENNTRLQGSSHAYKWQLLRYFSPYMFLGDCVRLPEYLEGIDIPSGLLPHHLNHTKLALADHLLLLKVIQVHPQVTQIMNGTSVCRKEKQY